MQSGNVAWQNKFSIGFVTRFMSMELNAIFINFLPIIWVIQSKWLMWSIWDFLLALSCQEGPVNEPREHSWMENLNWRAKLVLS